MKRELRGVAGSSQLNRLFTGAPPIVSGLYDTFYRHRANSALVACESLTTIVNMFLCAGLTQAEACDGCPAPLHTGTAATTPVPALPLKLAGPQEAPNGATQHAR